jgi:hypothetical protein
MLHHACAVVAPVSCLRHPEWARWSDREIARRCLTHRSRSLSASPLRRYAHDTAAVNTERASESAKVRIA